MSEKKQKTISLTKLEDTSHYRLWKVATEATFDVHGVLNIVLGTEAKPTAAEDADGEALAKIVDWERRHKLAKEALFSALKPAQLIRVALLDTAAAIWKRLSDEYGKISELKRAQLNTKLRSIQKSVNISMQKHIDQFELIQREIEFHSTAMSPEDVNIAFLLSLGESDVWKNYRNSNMHRAITMKTADLFAEVILIDDANHHAQGTVSGDSQEVKALAASFNRNNKRKRPSYPICFGCNRPGHVVSECPDAQESDEACRYCREDGHLIEDCLKLRWQNEQRRPKRTKSNGKQSNGSNGKSVEYRPSFELPKSVDPGKPPGRFRHSANTVNMIYD